MKKWVNWEETLPYIVPAIKLWARYWAYDMDDVSFKGLKVYFAERIDNTLGKICIQTRTITIYTEPNTGTTIKVLAHELAHWVQACNLKHQYLEKYRMATEECGYYANMYEREARSAELSMLVDANNYIACINVPVEYPKPTIMRNKLQDFPSNWSDWGHPEPNWKTKGFWRTRRERRGF